MTRRDETAGWPPMGEKNVGLVDLDTKVRVGTPPKSLDYTSFTEKSLDKLQILNTKSWRFSFK